MMHISSTPFGGRPVSAGLLAAQALAEQPSQTAEIDKWQLFHDLCTARRHFGVTDRDLSVLNALLSFLPSRLLEDGKPLIVFPSNAALSGRAHGMAESTLRRHLAALTAAGLIARNDSPNGKRFAARDRTGEVVRAFGFDLRPLLVQAADIIAAAEAEADAALRLRLERQAVVVRLRDATKLIAYGMEEGIAADWDTLTARIIPVQRGLRRQLTLNDLADFEAVLVDILTQVKRALSIEAEEMVGNVCQNERHYQNSKPDPYESEPCPEQGRADGVSPDLPALPLALVVKACPDIQPYAKGEIRHWHELVAAANFVRGMMGISPNAWSEAQRVMGAETSAVVLAAMLQRIDSIHKPGGYLRALTDKAALGGFSSGPMVLALLNTANSRAA